MADAAAPVASTSAPVKKAAKAKKPAAAKKAATHPKYTEMIAAAIEALKDRKGSSGQAIKKYIVTTYKLDEKAVGSHVRVALKRGVAAGTIKQVKGAGASGSFKLPDKTAGPKKAPAAKKVKTPKKAKTTTEKPAVKKSPKKSVKKAAKSPASKKPKAKKAKKPVAKKVTPKK
ncbi:histone H1-delta [Hyalella azteca]|uniref:Histone H1-delta n=1 Tax=Hyalella azteca TaxID=294128 RepID=A0A8B7N0S1_HYAAZ|nr:histone H1-delta [Hyalella azteca]